MALKDWFNEETYFEFATNYLLQHKKAPSALVMRQAFGGNGSLTTHQTLLEKWKKERNTDLIELPQKVEEIIAKKSRELFTEGWKALETASKEQNLQIKQEADEAIQIARDALNRTTHEKNVIQKELDRISDELNRAQADNQSLQFKINEAEKFSFAAEEGKRVLSHRLAELNESTQREKNAQEARHAVREKEFKEQLSANELRYQTEINRREEENEAYKKENEGRISTIEIVRDELYQKLNQAGADIKFYETKYQQALKDLDEKNREIFAARKDCQTYLKEAHNKNLELVKQEGQIEQLEKQLHEYREKNVFLENNLSNQNLRIGELEEKLNQALQIKMNRIHAAVEDSLA